MNSVWIEYCLKSKEALAPRFCLQNEYMNITETLGPQGLIARKLPGYEYRSQQLEMAQLVSQAFKLREHLIVEAGTGVGKSFAYLAAAIELIAGQNDKRVVLSTHTIALQEQLIEKFMKQVEFSKLVNVQDAGKMVEMLEDLENVANINDIIGLAVSS